MHISHSNRCLLAESDPRQRTELAHALMSDGHLVSEAGDGPQALDLLSRNIFQVVITELELPGGVGGLELLGVVQEQSPTTPVIVTGSEASVRWAVEAMRRGAYDYQVKPLDLEHLRLTVTRALEKATLHNAFHYLRHEQPYLYQLEHIVAESTAMKRVLKQVQRLAPTDVTVLLTGETGTGKSLIAGAIHANSPRREGTLVTVNCAALTETLLESELFGHEKGAFTGAHKARIGRFQQAHGGTLFLDEVGEMSPAIQAKVLRAIEEQVIYRLGGSREIHVDVRIMAATNQDLARAVEEGRFRRDLYYRLNVAPLHIPPLRERRKDILPLAERFLRQFCLERNRPLLRLSDQAREALLTYHWPGNIRELRNVMERVSLFCDGPEVQVRDLDLVPTPPFALEPELEPEPRVAYFTADTLNLAALERKAIEVALERCDWVQKEAAALLGISERQMTYRLDKLDIRHPNFRTRRRRA